MALRQRVDSLKARHAEIEAQLREEESRPALDEIKVQYLKKEKLALKDEIERLEKELKSAA